MPSHFRKFKNQSHAQPTDQTLVDIEGGAAASQLRTQVPDH
jgi:hypothetical protein